MISPTMRRCAATRTELVSASLRLISRRRPLATWMEVMTLASFHERTQSLSA